MSTDRIVALGPDEVVAGTEHLRPGYDMKATAATTHGAFSAYIASVERPIPLHTHDYADEALFVLSGAMEVFIGDGLHRFEAGGFAFLPKGIPHAPRPAVGLEGPARFLVIHSPAGWEEFASQVLHASGGSAQSAGIDGFDNDEIAQAFRDYGWSLIDRDFWSKFDAGTWAPK